MMTLLKVGLTILYLPMKHLVRTKKKIVYLSRQSNELSMDMRLLSEEIQRTCPDVRQVFRLRMIDPGILSKIRYMFGMIGDLYHIAGAKVAICDTYSIPISCLKHKESLVVIQTWHALGAIKKFGWQSVGKDEGRSEAMSQAMHMHENYDYVLTPSRATGEFYREAFRVEDQKLCVLTLPHVDYMLDGRSDREHLTKLYPALRHKKLLLYVPTFRNGEKEIVESFAKEFALDEQYELVISLHPLSKVADKRRYEVAGGYNSFDLMKMADVIVTDYSACAFEASLLQVPVYFYVPDYELYKDNRGLNIDLEKELADCTFRDAAALRDALYASGETVQERKRQLGEFAKRYVENTEDCTKKMAAFVIASL